MHIAACLNSLRFDNTRHAKISEQHEGSLEWLWKHQSYLEWSSTESSDLLLIEGKPGSGKSTLMKYFHRSLLDREPRERQIVASFYYSYREGEKQTNHSNMLRSVLYDVLNQNEEFFFHFQSDYREIATGGGHAEWSYESLKGILRSFAKSHPVREQLYLVVDAVDESDAGERIDVINFLLELCSAKGRCVVKVFVASRPVAGLSCYSLKNHKTIRLQDVNYSDILKFATSFLDEPEFDIPPSNTYWAMKLAEKAQGAFIWVRLVREELLRCAREGYSESEVIEFLESLPTELEEIYKNIITRLETGMERNIVTGQKMLQFVLLTYRPLGVGELTQALAMRDNLDSGFPCSNEQLQGRLIRGMSKRIISCAGNLLEIKAQGDHGSSFPGPSLLELCS